MALQLTADGILTAIRDLGDAPEDIHASLQQRGIRGEPACETRCPLAVYLLLVFAPRAAVVNVDCDTAEVMTHDGCSVYVDLPCAAVNFVYQHDIGQYPDLLPDFDPGRRLASHV